MNVALTPELEKFVKAEKRRGGYPSRSAVVREALRRMGGADPFAHWTEEDKRLFREEIDRGHQRMLRGEGVDAEVVFEELLSRRPPRRKGA